MPKVILIIDRDRHWLDVVSRLFSASGYRAYIAENCDDALGIAGTCTPNCILLDQGLAISDMYRLRSCIRSQPRFARTLIVIIAGKVMGTADTAFLSLADALLIKQGSLGNIRAMVARLLGRARWIKNVLHKGDLELCVVNNTIRRRFGPPRKLSTRQFRFFALLVEQSPDIVPEDMVAMGVFGKPSLAGRHSALRALVHRLRGRLGPGLSRRIKNIKRRGWLYKAARLRSGIPGRSPFPVGSR